MLNRLLSELGEVYEKSDIKQYCLEHGHKWHYSLITTPMKSDSPLILGFNWGASGDKPYEPESSVVPEEFHASEVGSLSRIIPFCKRYYGNDFLSEASQSNYCFFRSKAEDQISNKDIQLCEPIFDQLIEAISPSIILCFSSKLRNYLLGTNRVRSKTSKSISYKRGARLVTFEATRAMLATGIEIKFLPHPNYPMKGDARSEAWEFCCGENSSA